MRTVFVNIVIYIVLKKINILRYKRFEDLVGIKQGWCEYLLMKCMC